MDKALKIAVNTRLLLEDKLEGIGWFTYETLKRITLKHPEHQFYFIFDRPYSDKFIFSKNGDHDRQKNRFERWRIHHQRNRF